MPNRKAPAQQITRKETPAAQHVMNNVGGPIFLFVAILILMRLSRIEVFLDDGNQEVVGRLKDIDIKA